MIRMCCWNGSIIIIIIIIVEQLPRWKHEQTQSDTIENVWQNLCFPVS